MAGGIEIIPPALAPGAPGPPVSAPPGSPTMPARAPGPNSWSYRAPPPTSQVPATAPGAGPLAVIGQILTAATVIISCGAMFHGDSSIPQAPPVPTVVDLDRAIVEIVGEQNDILSNAIQNHDWSYIASYTPGRLEAIMKLFPTNPEVAYSLFQMAYGKVLELMVRDALNIDERTSGYFEHRGGKNESDFWGHGPIEGIGYDITTPPEVEPHELRPGYGENLRTVPYRPPWMP